MVPYEDVWHTYKGAHRNSLIRQLLLYMNDIKQILYITFLFGLL
jgi:hypothetical protein